MDREVVAIFIQEGSKLFSELLRQRVLVRTRVTESSFEANKEESEAEKVKGEADKQQPEANNISTKAKAESIATGCVGCSLGHLGTCTGLLNEAMRFARSDGIRSNEVIDRISLCTDELNTLERVDLRPEMISELEGKQKELATEALNVSRQTRHGLEAISSLDDLEKIAAVTNKAKTNIARGWYKQLPQTDKEELTRRIIETIEEEH